MGWVMSGEASSRALLSILDREYYFRRLCSDSVEGKKKAAIMALQKRWNWE